MLNYLFTICLISIFSFGSNAQPSAKQGTLDLREVNFEEKTTLDLVGKWKVFPGEILTDENFSQPSAYFDPSEGWYNEQDNIRGAIEENVATYMLKVLMPQHTKNFSVKIPVVNTAYQLYINNDLVGSVGLVGTTKDETTPYWQPLTQSIALQPGENTIRLTMTNFHHARSGMFQPITLGTEFYLNSKRNLQVGGMLFLAGCLLVAGMFALGLFWFKTSDLFGLAFFFFCISYCLWIVSSSYYVIPSLFANWPWIVTLRLEYISLALAITFYGYFIKTVLENKVRWWPFHVSASASVLFMAITAIAPSGISTMLFPYYIAFVSGAYFILVLSSIKLVNFSHKLTWINLTGSLALLLVIALRVLSSNGHINTQYRLDLFGNMLFILSQALFLAIMFGRNYRMSSLAALAAARTRDEFLNTMSHELKTPMNAILGMATFLEKSKLSTSQQDKLRAIKNNSESLMSLINDVLSISEVGSGNLTLKNSVLSIESCLDSALALSKQHMRKGDVIFTSYIDPRIPAHLRGDSSRIKQVLMHILNHSFKNTSKGAVEVRATLRDKDEDTASVHFEISDTGAKAKYNQSKSVFSLFNNRQGLGIDLRHSETGIHVANELIELMGGQLEYVRENSKLNHVSFVLRFDRHKASDYKRIKSVRKQSEVDPTLKILYAEDNPVNQKLIILMLDALGLKADIANNGAEAVEKASRKYYNIILMDINMPEMDGLEASQRIIENCTSRPIIIATTANMAEVDKRKCFEAGMNDFVSKPINQDELKLALIKWQGLKQYLDESNDNIIQLSS